ncbi:MAG: chemotaxis protein CheB [Bacteroidota bacterium]
MNLRADAYKDELAGIVMTGSNSDGADGVQAIRRAKGLTIVQDPNEAQFPVMPEAAIKTGSVDHIMTIDRISKFLLDII